MTPTIRLRPDTPADTLPTLKAAAMDAAEAAAEFERQAQRLYVASSAYADRCRAESAGLSSDLGLNQRNAARLLAEAAATDAALEARLVDLQPMRNQSLAQFNRVTAGGLEVFRVLGRLLQQQTDSLLSNWQVLDAEARKRQRTTGAQLRSLSEILQALVAEQRSVHASLSKLASHIGEEERAVREEEQARKHAEAMRLTTAGCGALQRGSIAQAATLFASAWENHATPHTAFNYALALLLGGRDAEARRLLEDPVLKSCSPVEVQILRALRALLARDLAVAAREAEAGLQLSPDHSMLKQILAAAAFKHSPGAAIQQPEAIPQDLRTWLAKDSAPAIRA